MSIYKSSISSNIMNEDEIIGNLKLSLLQFKRLVEKFQRNYNCSDKEKEAVKTSK